MTRAETMYSFDAEGVNDENCIRIQFDSGLPIHIEVIPTQKGFEIARIALELTKTSYKELGELKPGKLSVMDTFRGFISAVSDIVGWEDDDDNR